jgi:hypothetical protein
MEPTMAAGGNVVEFHSVDFFPERWFDLVLVLRTDNTTLYDRLKARLAACALASQVSPPGPIATHCRYIRGILTSLRAAHDPTRAEVTRRAKWRRM